MRAARTTRRLIAVDIADPTVTADRLATLFGSRLAAAYYLQTVIDVLLDGAR